MYGTIAKLQITPGAAEKLLEIGKMYEDLDVPGLRGVTMYQMDTDPSEYMLTVFFDNKDAYQANAASPEQDARYQKLRALLARDPEWHDGEVVYDFWQD